jgi:hypothetical protein
MLRSYSVAARQEEARAGEPRKKLARRCKGGGKRRGSSRRDAETQREEREVVDVTSAMSSSRAISAEKQPSGLSSHGYSISEGGFCINDLRPQTRFYSAIAIRPWANLDAQGGLDFLSVSRSTDGPFSLSALGTWELTMVLRSISRSTSRASHNAPNSSTFSSESS